MVRAELELATSGFQVRRPDHSATLPPIICDFGRPIVDPTNFVVVGVVVVMWNILSFLFFFCAANGVHWVYMAVNEAIRPCAWCSAVSAFCVATHFERGLPYKGCGTQISFFLIFSTIYTSSQSCQKCLENRNDRCSLCRRGIEIFLVATKNVIVKHQHSEPSDITGLFISSFSLFQICRCSHRGCFY